MKINRRLTVPLLALMFAVQASAREVTVFLNGMSEGQKFSVELLDRIYFSNGNMVLNRGGVETPIQLSMIKKICFGGTVTGIGQTTAADGVKPAIVGDELRLAGYDPTRPLPAAIYGINGSLYMSVKALAADAVDVASLPKGIFVLKLGDKSFKLYK